jgi:hypothetical protein
MSDFERRGLLDAYFEALATGDPAPLPLAAGVRFTENGQELPLGKGLWATATGVAARRTVVVADSGEGQVAGWGMVTEAGQDALVGVRLKTDGDGAIGEIETLVARRPLFGRTAFPETLFKPSPYIDDIIDPARRGTRADLIAAANGYLDGVARDDAELIPAADECVRFENGLQTTLNAEAVGFPPEFALHEGLKLGVREQVRTSDFRYIEDIRDRRFPVADTERGLVLAMVFFDHPGQLREADFTSPVASPNSMIIWELFKVGDGLIRRIEAILSPFPYGMRAGW